MTLDIPQGSKARWCPYSLQFKFSAQTSRATMTVKDTYFICIDTPDGQTIYAEAPLFKGLSAEDTQEFETLLSQACANPAKALADGSVSAINFAFEAAAMKLAGVPSSNWAAGYEGIPINGLIWMGSKELMRKRIGEKLDQGFRILKLKIGGINFDDEVELLRAVRRSFAAADLELRLDANGNFTADNALKRLDTLAQFDIHSLEQPLKAGQISATAHLCRVSPIAIALDEELIGTRSRQQKEELLGEINPQYIILKPALCGGFRSSEEYIDIIGPSRWWVTSALESNIGLYDIASWLSHKEIAMPQGLGTGQLYHNNIESPLEMRNAALFVRPTAQWGNMENLQWRT